MLSHEKMPRNYTCARCNTSWSSSVELKTHVDTVHRDAKNRLPTTGLPKKQPKKRSREKAENSDSDRKEQGESKEEPAKTESSTLEPLLEISKEEQSLINSKRLSDAAKDLKLPETVSSEKILESTEIPKKRNPKPKGKKVTVIEICDSEDDSLSTVDKCTVTPTSIVRTSKTVPKKWSELNEEETAMITSKRLSDAAKKSKKKETSKTSKRRKLNKLKALSVCESTDSENESSSFVSEHSVTPPKTKGAGSAGSKSLWSDVSILPKSERRTFDTSEMLLDVLNGEGADSLSKTSTTDWIATEMSTSSFKQGKQLTQIKTGQSVLSAAKELWKPLVVDYGELGEHVKPMLQDTQDFNYAGKKIYGRANQAWANISTSIEYERTKIATLLTVAKRLEKFAAAGKTVNPKDVLTPLLLLIDLSQKTVTNILVTYRILRNFGDPGSEKIVREYMAQTSGQTSQPSMDERILAGFPSHTAMKLLRASSNTNSKNRKSTFPEAEDFETEGNTPQLQSKYSHLKKQLNAQKRQMKNLLRKLNPEDKGKGGKKGGKTHF